MESATKLYHFFELMRKKQFTSFETSLSESSSSKSSSSEFSSSNSDIDEVVNMIKHQRIREHLA